MRYYAFLLLLFFSFSLLAQTNQSAFSNETDYKSIQKDIENVEPVDTSAETSQENSNSIDLSKLDPVLLKQLQDFQRENESFLKQVQANQDNPAALFRMITKTKGAGKGETEFEKILKGALISYRIIPENNLRLMLLQKMNGTSFYKFFIACPKVLLYITKLLRDENALPALYGIIKDRVRLFIFIIVNLVIVIIAWLIKRRLALRSRTLFERFRLWFLRFAIVLSVRVGVLILFFHQDLGPTWRIFVNVFLS